MFIMFTTSNANVCRAEAELTSITLDKDSLYLQFNFIDRFGDHVHTYEIDSCLSSSVVEDDEKIRKILEFLYNRHAFAKTGSTITLASLKNVVSEMYKKYNKGDFE